MPASHSRHSAFTLVEMLLVIVVITIVTLVTLPTLRNSIRGSRLKAAAQTVISSGRYARSMAVMKQQPMLVTFNMGQSIVSVVPVNSGTPHAAATPQPMPSGDSSDTNAPTTTGATGNETLTRKLERVKIIEVSADEGDDSTTIIYGTNGRCTPYTIKLQDDYDTIMVIHVDALATATTEGK